MQKCLKCNTQNATFFVIISFIIDIQHHTNKLFFVPSPILPINPTNPAQSSYNPIHHSPTIATHHSFVPIAQSHSLQPRYPYNMSHSKSPVPSFQKVLFHLFCHIYRRFFWPKNYKPPKKNLKIFFTYAIINCCSSEYSYTSNRNFFVIFISLHIWRRKKHIFYHKKEDALQKKERRLRM